MDFKMQELIEAVRKAGEIILNATGREDCVTAKDGKKNFVTEYDIAVQNFLREQLSNIIPEAEFVGEEGDGIMSSTALRFVVDPIDGTTNFMQDYHCSCISVALCEGDQPVLGIIYNPYLNEIFSAQKDKGAYLNGKKISVSNRTLSDGLALFGTSPYHPENTDKTFVLLRKVFDYSRDIRRSGSAAYDICMVACGRCEIFFEKELQPWDYAAGTVILREAGGIAETYDGQTPCLSHGSDVVFSNKKAINEFKTLL
ncbi:MAG: inositol monophosphatase [Clostridia bacterium]|nr:inositol monophosphatase [Clostridia bacterium]